MLHQIGNGALGPVFRAYDQDRDRLAAIKLFRLDLPPERVHQLIGEFEKIIAAELQHPVIAAPRATGIDSNSAYLALDFAAADSLDVVLRENGAAPPAQAVRVASQLAEALDYAADRQIVHGALHPRDILLSDDDIRIVGLGVARALERVGVDAPVRLPYAAPERINDSGWDRTADVFSLAAIVFEMLCGKRVTGTGSEAAESLTEVSGADMEALQRVFALALAGDPSYRYATATAFTDALKDAMGMEAAPARSRPKRRPKLRVVTTETELGLPLDEVAEVAEVPGVPEVLESRAPSLEFRVPSPEPQAPNPEALAPSPEEDAVIPVVPVRKPRRRRAPAPTPVAIETVAAPMPEQVPVEESLAADDLIPVQEEVVAETVHELVLEPEAIAEPEPEPTIELRAEPVPEPFIEPEPEPFVEPEPEPVVEPAAELPPFVQSLAEPEPEPEAIAEVIPEPVIEAEPPNPEPEIFASPEFRAPSPEPQVASFQPVFSNFEPRTSNLEPQRTPNLGPAAAVWPIGVAAVLGIALGFGAGYMVAIRDKAVAPVTAAASVATPTAAPVAPEPSPAVDVVLPPEPKLPVEPAQPNMDAKGEAWTGRMLVRSTPPGARVFVDGKDRGQTPLTIRELGQGEHRVRIARDGYTAAERRVVLSEKQASQSLSVRLGKDPASAKAAPPSAAAVAATATGGLVVESRPPGASVLVDGQHVGTTPLTLGDVRAGNHAIRIERDGYRIWTSGVNVAAGQQNRITASLEK